MLRNVFTSPVTSRLKFSRRPVAVRASLPTGQPRPRRGLLWRAMALMLSILFAPVATPLRRLFVVTVAACAGLLAYAVYVELTTSRLQARYLAALGQELYYWVDEGQNPAMHFPTTGPYDRRLGYTHIPTASERLARRGYEVSSQARLSPRMEELVDKGLFPLYDEKSHAGLEVLDRHGKPVYKVSFPEHGFASFDEIPPLVVQTLLFIENRNLLDENFPTFNPAIEWRRFIGATLAMGARYLGASGNVFGGSTLATQIEKFRHSDEGRTKTSSDKLRQMATASLRAYAGGENTIEAQRRIVLEYLNGVPLAAVAGHGEVHGLADGLRAWYGVDHSEVMAAFTSDRPTIYGLDSTHKQSDTLMRQAEAYRRVLSLMLAHRRPSYFLAQDPKALSELTDQYLRILARAGVISTALRDVALVTTVEVNRGVPVRPTGSFVERKAVDGIRTHMMVELGLKGLYDLDRLDLTARTTIDGQAQGAVTDVLSQLHDPVFATTLGLKGHRLLSAKSDLSSLVYSFTLYERTPVGNVLRVQADSYDQPLNINEQVKLDLGSTAKLRTLVTYLEIVAELHGRFHVLEAATLRQNSSEAKDNLTRWAADYLARAKDRSLETMLEAAMNRQYSGSPSENFFTGGGVHTFSNFDNKRNHVMSVHEAFRHSVNLPFIRMMRDIARYYLHLDAGRADRIINDVNDFERRIFLERFADQEGRTFQDRYVRKYRAKNPEAVLEALASGRKLTPKQLAVAYRAVAPEQDIASFSDFMRRHASSVPGDKLLDELYQKHAPGAFNLADQGYLARVHPLELWTANYMRNNQEAGYEQIIEASRSERQQVYRWLFRTSRKHQQDKRIRIMLEDEAFTQIHASWQRLGYPFDSLVPSYATAIGSSADRPAALAELVGIILNDGARLPTVRVEEYEFAKNTPFETVIGRKPPEAQQILAPEVAHVTRRALLDVVQSGTARRVEKAFVTLDGEVLEVGGKTGTGDHRIKRYAGGRLIESRAINRTATFAFFVGERFFGTLTVFVPGEDAANFQFTSALPAQLLRALAPGLMLMIDPVPEPDVEQIPELINEPAGEALLVAQLNDEPRYAPERLLAVGLPAWTEMFAAGLMSVELEGSQPERQQAMAEPAIFAEILPSWPLVFGAGVWPSYLAESDYQGPHFLASMHSNVSRRRLADAPTELIADDPLALSEYDLKDVLEADLVELGALANYLPEDGAAGQNAFEGFLTLAWPHAHPMLAMADVEHCEITSLVEQGEPLLACLSEEAVDTLLGKQDELVLANAGVSASDEDAHGALELVAATGVFEIEHSGLPLPARGELMADATTDKPAYVAPASSASARPMPPAPGVAAASSAASAKTRPDAPLAISREDIPRWEKPRPAPASFQQPAQRPQPRR